MKTVENPDFAPLAMASRIGDTSPSKLVCLQGNAKQVLVMDLDLLTGWVLAATIHELQSEI